MRWALVGHQKLPQELSPAGRQLLLKGPEIANANPPERQRLVVRKHKELYLRELDTFMAAKLASAFSPETNEAQAIEPPEDNALAQHARILTLEFKDAPSPPSLDGSPRRNVLAKRAGSGAQKLEAAMLRSGRDIAILSELLNDSNTLPMRASKKVFKGEHVYEGGCPLVSCSDDISAKDVCDKPSHVLSCFRRTLAEKYFFEAFAKSSDLKCSWDKCGISRKKRESGFPDVTESASHLATADATVCRFITPDGTVCGAEHTNKEVMNRHVEKAHGLILLMKYEPTNRLAFHCNPSTTAKIVGSGLWVRTRLIFTSSSIFASEIEELGSDPLACTTESKRGCKSAGLKRCPFCLFNNTMGRCRQKWKS
ncbi:hypothetical protein HDU90_001919 [Geranomyces variabilis]|nr:hypothetical protein HDU90_001919 [Geranomyces variabilis]